MTAPLVIHMLRVVRALRKGAYRRATFFLISDALRSRHEGIFGFERSGKCRLRPSTALGNFRAGESVADFGVYSKAGMHYADVDAPLFTSADPDRLRATDPDNSKAQHRKRLFLDKRRRRVHA